MQPRPTAGRRGDRGPGRRFRDAVAAAASRAGRCSPRSRPALRVAAVAAVSAHRDAGAGPVRAGVVPAARPAPPGPRSEEHTSELQSLMRISYAVFCLTKKKKKERVKTCRNLTNYTTTNYTYTEH